MLYTVMVDRWDQMNYRLSKPFHLLSSCYVLEVFVLFIKVSLVTGLIWRGPINLRLLVLPDLG